MRAEEDVTYQPIGVVHSPFHEAAGMPIQPTSEAAAEGSVEVFEEYAEGLADLEGFSHIILIYDLHKASGFSLRVKPFLDDELRGIFSTRSPHRPNSIAISIVELDAVEGRILHIKNVDILDGTPLLDIKPYIPAFDTKEKVSTGWYKRTADRFPATVSDDRFVAKAKHE